MDPLSEKTVITGLRYLDGNREVQEEKTTEFVTLRENGIIQVLFTLDNAPVTDLPEFRFRLARYPEKGEWFETGDKQSILLSGLDQGQYTLEIAGSSNGFQAGTNPAVLHLEVVAPFYRRPLFKGLIILPLLFFLIFLVEYRNRTLKASNRTLREKQIIAKEVLRQKNLLSLRTKNIEDSLKYAQRIQYAMFTSESEIRKMFPESFVIQMPKDIVSGDFYWAKKINHMTFLAAADCTGHGVPGAFMSLIGLEFFRQIIEKQGIFKPSHILNEINRNFDLIFGNMDSIGLRDGMDLSMCMIDTHKDLLYYSGAFNPLYIIRNGEIIEIKGDKTLLGPDLGFGRKPFTNHEIALEKEDIIYLFTDGYADQFGGPEGKKFNFRRFRHLLLSVFDQPLDLQQQVLANSFAEWRGNLEQVDDILVVGVKPFTTN